MSKYIINGGNKLSGTVRISGNKNSVLPCIAATLLTDKEVVLENVSKIADVEVMLKILESLGAKVRRNNYTVKIQTPSLKNSSLPQPLIKKLRASVLLAGPLLARHNKVKFSHPGGDVIGKRNIDTHLEGFKKLGFRVRVDDLEYSISGEKRDEDCSLFLEEASCTATENLIMASVLGKNTVVLKNAAREPQIVDLCNLLNKMGARIKGQGDSTITIKGVNSLKGAKFAIGPDYIEMATYAIASAITGGEIIMTHCSLEDLEPIIKPLEKMGVTFKQSSSRVLVSRNKLRAIPKLTTNIWPGFPTDLMSAMIVLATQARGVSLMHDWMYESRMFFVDKLISMGANITIADPHRVFISGLTRLHSRDLETPDIRAGMALVLAALVAKGESTINRAELIERGYEKVVENFSSLGAKISKLT